MLSQYAGQLVPCWLPLSDPFESVTCLVLGVRSSKLSQNYGTCAVDVYIQVIMWIATFGSRSASITVKNSGVR
jgi:hypothetical protein